MFRNVSSQQVCGFHYIADGTSSAVFELIAFCVADNAESGLVDGTELLVAKLRPNADLAWVGNQFLVIQHRNFKSLIRGWRLDIAQRRGGGLEIQLVELSHNNLTRRSAGKFIR